MLVGFLFAYCGLMGSIVVFGLRYGSLAIEFVFLPASIFGLALIGIAKLMPPNMS